MNKIEKYYGSGIIAKLKLQNHYYMLSLVSTVIAIVYVFMISLLPDLITDDYNIFYLIDRYPSKLFTTDPDEKYFLFYRPVSYFYYWILYTAFGNNPMLMKISALIILLVAIILLYKTISNIACYYQVELSGFIVTCVLLFVAFHPDIIQSVLWISNANELLMTVFYLLALYFVSGIIINKFKAHIGLIIAVSAAYLLSILSKQQSLHFPILIILFMFAGGETTGKKKRALWIIAGIGIAIMTALLISNAMLYLSRDTSDSLFMTIWKKPFALLGTIFYISFPLIGLDIYSYLLSNKIIAIVISIASILPIYLLFKKYRISKKILILVLILIIIILFPRIMLPMGDRINVLQIFSLGIAIPIVFSGNNRKLSYTIAAIAFIGMVGGAYTFKNLLVEMEYANKMNNDLKVFILKEPTGLFIPAYSSTLSATPYSIYYMKHNQFGLDSAFIDPGVIIRNHVRGFARPMGITADITSDIINIKTRDEKEGIYIDRTKGDPTIINAIMGIRGYSSVSYRLPLDISRSNPKIIVYADSGWTIVN